MLSKYSERRKMMKNSLTNTVGMNVFILRRMKKMSRTDLCEKARISTQTLNKIEQGEGNPTLITLHTIARALGVNVSTLFVEQALCQIFGEELEDEPSDN